MTRVLDYSVGRPSPASIVNVRDANGQQVYSGVMRYVAPLIDAPKIVTATEYAALRAAGLAVGLNWEWYANRAAEGAAAGTADAQEALRQADALGYRGAIYFSVDFDAAPADQAGINAYFSACAQVIGLQRLGAYAGYWPLSRLFDAGLIVYGWQTIAWSGGRQESRAHLYQDTFGLFGGDADGNEVLRADWLGGNMVPTGWTDDGTTLTAPNGNTVQYGFRKKILVLPDFDAANLPLNNEYQTSTGSRQDFMQFSFVYTTANEQIGYASVGADLQAATAEIATLKAAPPVTVPDPKAVAAKAALQAWLAEP